MEILQRPNPSLLNRVRRDAVTGGSFKVLFKPTIIGVAMRQITNVLVSLVPSSSAAFGQVLTSQTINLAGR